MITLTERKSDESRLDRVRRNTPDGINRSIDRQTSRNIEHYRIAGQNEISRRLRELEREWDIERMLELSASTMALAGLILGVTKDRRWLAVPGVVFSFLLQHSVQGWCPPLPIFRALGFRTRQEIDHEKHALLEAAAGR